MSAAAWLAWKWWQSCDAIQPSSVQSALVNYFLGAQPYSITFGEKAVTKSQQNLWISKYRPHEWRKRRERKKFHISSTSAFFLLLSDFQFFFSMDANLQKKLSHKLLMPFCWSENDWLTLNLCNRWCCIKWSGWAHFWERTTFFFWGLVTISNVISLYIL